MRWLRGLRRDQHGFTMVSVVTGMMVIGMFSLGAYSAAVGDISIGRKDQDRKIAEAAAKAGIEWYTFHLLRDTNYWTYCNDPARVVTPGISLQGMNRPANAWRNVPNSGEGQYQVELMTADGNAMTYADCNASPATKMLKGGVLRIRSTGRSRGVQRQIVSTFRRNSFLDYLWYTEWETSPPAVYPATGTNDDDWAKANCDKPRTQRSLSCTAISFAPTDETKGPMHTEDSSFLLCGTPQMGETSADNVEITAAPDVNAAFVFNDDCSGNGTGDVKGTKIAPARSLDLPPSNAGLAYVANVVTTGQTCVEFNANGTMTVWENQTWNGTVECSGTSKTYTLGLNTVLYTKNDANAVPGCSGQYTATQRYNDVAACGNVAVKGTYTGNVTVGAANDIIVNGDLKKPDNGDQMMGLIAQDFVRVYHPAINSSGSCSSSAGSGISRLNRIDAAILSLEASFIVDNYGCGSNLGDLTVLGNIAQKWRGPVGMVSGSGYIKDYQYDRRLAYRQPPQYLDPLKAAWRILRQSEQSPVK